MSIAPSPSPASVVGALAALFAAGQDRDAQAGALGQRRDRGEMLAGQDFGRRHQRRLAAGLDGARHGEQRHHRLAGADIALQQAQHALGLARGRRRSRPAPVPASRSANRAGRRAALRRRGRRRSAAGRTAAARWRAPAPATAGRPGTRHRRAAARPRPRATVDRIGRIVQRAAAPRRRRESSGGAATSSSSHSGSAGSRASAWPIARRSTLRRQPGGQRIDRLDQRQALRVAGQRDVVGMDHRRAAVEPFHAAADDDVLADRHRLFQPGGVGVEEGQRDLAGVVMRDRPGRAPSGCRAAAAGGGRSAPRA